MWLHNSNEDWSNSTKLTKLTYLDITRCKLDDACLTEVSQLANLSQLNIEYYNIHGES